MQDAKEANDWKTAVGVIDTRLNLEREETPSGTWLSHSVIVDVWRRWYHCGCCRGGGVSCTLVTQQREVRCETTAM